MEKGFILAQSMVVRKFWQQELEAAGHITPTSHPQLGDRHKDAIAQLASSFSFCPGPKPMESLTVRVSLPPLISSVYKLPHRHDQRSILKKFTAYKT